MSSIEPRLKRKARIRRKLSGTAERPRLTVYKSLKHIYAQVVDDTTGRTLAFASSLSKELKGKEKLVSAYEVLGPRRAAAPRPGAASRGA